MLHIPREGVNLALLDYCLCNKLYYKELTEDEINAYLLFDGSLNVSSEGYEPPITCLPIVPDNEFMFGAYEALSTSGHSYARNIKKTINIYKERDQEGLYKVSSIFFDAEYGKKIKSLFSIALYASESPIGVLNIHSNQKNYLGKEKLYYPSFVTLMIPLVNLLTNHLHIYQKVLLYSYDSIKLEIND